MVIEIYTARGHCSGRYYCYNGEKEALEEAERCMCLGRVGNMPEEQKHGEGEGEKGYELGMGRRHTVTLSVHF